MKVSTALLIGGTALLAVTAGYLARELGVARAEADESARLAQYLTTRVAELERSRSSAAGPTVRPGLHFGGAATPGTALPVVAGASTPPGETVVALVSGQMPLQRRSPAALRVMRGQARASARQMYSDLAVSLGLSPEEANALYDLIVERDMQAANEPQMGSEPVEQMQERWMERSRAFSQKSVAVLGSDNAARLQDYERSFGSRAEISQLGDQLSALDMPLSEDQRQRLVRAALQDSAQFPGPQLSANQTPEQMQQTYANWERDRKERLAAALRPILNPQQRQHFEDLRETELDAAQNLPGAEP